MKLQNEIVVTSTYKGKSQFPFWHNIQVGDRINISIELASPGRGRSLYATNVTLVNLRDKSNAFATLTTIGQYFRNLTYTED